jgi:ABC-2 type transport system ATP-binding protein
VFVSSHLMSEMSLTADHLIVIGRGKLLADVATKDFIDASSSNSVRVRSPQQDALAALLQARDVPVQHVDGYLQLEGLSTDQVGDLAAANGVTIHELFAERASLEAAFMEMTRDSVDFHTDVTTQEGAR